MFARCSRTSLSIAVLIIVSGAPALAGQPADAERSRSLYLVGDRDYPPVTYLQSGMPKGVDVDIAEAIADRLGLQLHIELMDWDEAQHRVLDGRADGLLSMSVTDDRRKLFDFTEPTLTRDFGLFVRRGGGLTAGTADLTGRRIGVTAGGYPRQFLSGRGARNLVLVGNYEDGFNRLAEGSIDAVAADTWVAAHTAQRLGRNEIHLSGAPFAALSGAMAFRKDSPFVGDVSAVIRQLRADGTLAAIYDRWRPDEVMFVSERRLRRIVAIGTIGVSAVVLAVTGAGTYGWRRQRELRARIAREESTRDELTAQVRHSQKMDAVGRLAAGMVHDFNNLITVIVASCDEGLSTPGIQDDVRERFEDVRSAGNSAAALAKQLLSFSRRPIVQPRVMNINDVVTDTARLIERLIASNIGLQLRLDPQLGPIVADAVQIQQVLVNLAVNASDAMPSGGLLAFETRNVSVGHEELTSHSQMPPGHYVLLLVSDTGVGMDAAILAQIFEPFFTTKAGNGTGLGLSTVYSIVKQSGGFIWAQSEIGRGSTFKIYLPRIDDGALSRRTTTN